MLSLCQVFDRRCRTLFQCISVGKLVGCRYYGFAQSQNGGTEYIIPDFTNEEERKQWENDHESPFPDENGQTTMPCCSHPDYMPTDEDFAHAEEEWQEAGLKY